MDNHGGCPYLIYTIVGLMIIRLNEQLCGKKRLMPKTIPNPHGMRHDGSFCRTCY